MKYGIFNHKVLDTSPGSGGPFSPPVNFENLRCSYRQFMVGQLRVEIGVRQHVGAVARRMKSSEPPIFIGPYAAEAEKVALDVLPRLASRPRSLNED